MPDLDELAKRMRENPDGYSDIAYFFPKAQASETVCPGDGVAMVRRDGRLCATRTPLAEEEIVFWSVCANNYRPGGHHQPKWLKPYAVKNPLRLSKEETVCDVILGVAAARLLDLVAGHFDELGDEATEVEGARNVLIRCSVECVWNGGMSALEAIEKIRRYTRSPAVASVRPVMGSTEHCDFVERAMSVRGEESASDEDEGGSEEQNAGKSFCADDEASDGDSEGCEYERIGAIRELCALVKDENESVVLLAPAGFGKSSVCRQLMAHANAAQDVEDE